MTIAVDHPNIIMPMLRITVQAAVRASSFPLAR
jgi:hypothetical protein